MALWRPAAVLSGRIGSINDLHLLKESQKWQGNEFLKHHVSSHLRYGNGGGTHILVQITSRVKEPALIATFCNSTNESPS
jgi:hypothetical protein